MRRLPTVVLFAILGMLPAAAHADSIDAALDAMWAKAGVTPAPEASDSEFLRRVTLDVAGRVPTPGEAEAYLDDTSDGKREALVDRLLASTDYADHWGSIYADLFIGRELRMRPRVQRFVGDYFSRVIESNKPYDELTVELLTATGNIADNPAGSYLALERLRGGNLEQSAGRTARLFLGLQIQCAQCHDHPYEKRFSQSDFSEFTAFFGRTRIRRQRVDGQPQIELEDFNGKLGKRQKRRLTRRIAKRPMLRYALMEPRFFGEDLGVAAGESRRAAVARRIIASDLFPKVTVNRVWAQLLGSPIEAPWDDLGYFDSPDHAPLLSVLARQFRDSGFDHKKLIRAIVLSKAYTRTSRSSASRDSEREKVFAKATVRALSADQLFSSQLLATGIEQAAERKLRRTVLNRRKQRALREFLFTFGDDEGSDADAFTGSVPQALLLLNGAITNLGALAGEGMVLGRILKATRAPAQRVEWMFLSTYSRRPTASETRRYTDYIAGRSDAEAAYEDLFHALLTSSEFITNH